MSKQARDHQPNPRHAKRTAITAREFAADVARYRYQRMGVAR